MAIRSLPPEPSTGADGSDDHQEEFDSPATVEAAASVIRASGHNFAEGLGVSRSREARVPAVLEMLGIPSSGSESA